MKVRERERSSKKTGQKFWVYVMDGTIDGRRVTKVVPDVRADTSQERAKAMRKAQRLASDAWRKVEAPEKRREVLLLGHILDAFIEERGATCVPDWIENLKNYRRHVVGYFGEDSRFNRLDDSALAGYRRHRFERGLKASTLNKEQNLIRGAGLLAQRRRQLQELPWQRMEQAIDREGREAWTYLERDEKECLLDVLRHGAARTIQRMKDGQPYKKSYESIVEPSAKLYRQVLFLLDTGARRGEMFRLRWDDVDLNRGTVRLVGTKSAKRGRSAKARYVPMTHALRELFDGMPKGQPNALVFSTDENLHRKFKAALRSAALREIRIHDLRHTFASHLVTGGVPLYTVSKLLGHASIEMTQRYAHLAPETFAHAIAVLDARDTATIVAIQG